MSRRSGFVIALLVALAPWLTQFPQAPSAVAQSLGGAPTGQFTPQGLQSGEIASMRTRTSRTIYSHGQYVTTVSAGSLNYTDASGNWQPIDNTLVPSTVSGYAYQNNANRYIVRFPADIGIGPVHVESGSAWANFSLVGASGSGSVSGATDTFALPSGALAYTAESDGVKEAITLARPSSPATYTFNLTTSTGLTPKQNAAGGIDFVTGTGQIPFSFAPPSMTDQAGASSRSVTLTVAPATSGWTVVVSADATWLADPSRSYPVTIDPTVIIQPATQDCYLEANNPNTNYCGYGGYIETDNYGGWVYHGLVQFAIPQSIPSSATVTNADLALYLVIDTSATAKEADLYQVTHSWTTAATWNEYDGTNAWTTPGGDTTGSAAAVNTSVGPTISTWYHWYPTSLVQSWVNGTAANDGMLLQEQASTSQSILYFAASNRTTTADRPTLTITWAPDLGALPWYTLDHGVNVANGNLVLGGTDVSMGGIGIPLTVGRTYNGLSRGTSDFGNRWVMDSGADVGLQVAADGSVLLNGPTGYQAVFIKNGDGTYTHPPGIDADLVKNTDGSYALTAHANGEKLNFSSGGVLTSDVTTTGNTLTYNYTGSLLSSITDTLGQTTTFTYASPVSPNLISKITDAAGRTYQYGYDANKNLTSYTTPNNETTHYGYDASGNLTSITDPNNNITTIGYDTSGRVTSITDALNHITSYTYNSGSTVVTDPNTHQKTYTYDVQGRVTSITDALNHTTSTTWNSDNHTTSVTLPSSATTTYTYASNNENVTKVQLADGVTASASYGNPTWLYYPTAVTDAQGNSSTIAYNTATGTVASVTDASNHSVSYTYNSNGTLASQTDENGHKTTYTYASNGLPQADNPPCPGGSAPPCASSPTPEGPFTYAFNSYNLQSSLTDGNNKQTAFHYDLNGRLSSEVFADSTSLAYTYDADGNVTTMTDSSGTTSYTYNALNELTSETTPNTPTISCPAPNSGITASTCYAYDAVGNLTSKTDAGGTVSYIYNQIDEVTNVTDRQGNPYTVGYNQDGNQTSIGLPNGVTEAMTYDSAGALTKIKGSKGTSTLTSYSYSYTNPSTNAVTSLPYSVTNTSNLTTNYTYDNTNALTQAQQKNSGGTVLSTWAFGYDAAGNLTSKQLNSNPQTTFSYNANNQLTTASGGLNATYTYDGNGDRTSVTVQGQNPQNISLNAAGQITSITPPSGTAVPYSYTGVGEQQRIGAGSNSFRYDGTGLNKQTDSVGDTYYTSLPDGALLAETIPAGDPTCPAPGSSCSYYYLSDGAGSVAAVTDSTGAVKNTYAYDPLGNATSTGNVPNSFTFNGWMFDSQTGYYYTGSGYFDPATGQGFGCKDRGHVDARGMGLTGEDYCGEDEAPYDDSVIAGKTYGPCPLAYFGAWHCTGTFLIDVNQLLHTKLRGRFVSVQEIATAFSENGVEYRIGHGFPLGAGKHPGCLLTGVLSQGTPTAVEFFAPYMPGNGKRIDQGGYEGTLSSVWAGVPVEKIPGTVPSVGSVCLAEFSTGGPNG